MIIDQKVLLAAGTAVAAAELAPSQLCLTPLPGEVSLCWRRRCGQLLVYSVALQDYGLETI